VSDGIISEVLAINQFRHNPILVTEHWLKHFLPSRERLHNSRISFDIAVFLSCQDIEGTNPIVEDKIYGMEISIFLAAPESSASSETIGKITPISPLPPLL
jgi:hypothetical protein